MRLISQDAGCLVSCYKAKQTRSTDGVFLFHVILRGIYELQLALLMVFYGSKEKMGGI
jgi:ABC-type arginine transport system permease subunit